MGKQSIGEAEYIVIITHDWDDGTAAYKYTDSEAAEKGLRRLWDEYMSEEIEAQSDLIKSECYCDGSTAQVRWGDGTTTRFAICVPDETGKMEMEKKIYVYKEYNDEDAYGEELIELYEDRKDALDRLRKGVEQAYRMPWWKIPSKLGLGNNDTFTEDYVAIGYPDGPTSYYIVEEKRINRKSQI